MILKLILILINLPVISQDKFIGSVERLSPEIDNLIEKSAKIEILASISIFALFSIRLSISGDNLSTDPINLS